MYGQKKASQTCAMKSFVLQRHTSISLWRRNKYNFDIIRMDIDCHQRYLKLNRFEIRLHYFLFTFESYSVSILSLQRAMFLKQRVPLNKSKVWVWMNFNWQSATIFNNVECPVIRYSMCYNKLQLEKNVSKHVYHAKFNMLFLYPWFKIKFKI